MTIRLSPVLWLVLASASAASAEEIKPFLSRRIAVDAAQGVVFFRPGREAYEVVATLDGGGRPLRIVAALRSGQSLELSAPGDAGSRVEIRRDGDRVLVTDRSAAAPDADPPQDILSGP